MPKRFLSPSTRRHSRCLLSLIFLATTGTICRSSTNPGGVGAGADATSSIGYGMFSGTDATGASVGAILSDLEVFLYSENLDGGVQSSLLAAANLGGDNGEDDLEITSPAGIASGTFNVNVSVTGPPDAGSYTVQSAGASGGVALAYSTASVAEDFSTTGGNGTWTFDLTSVVPPDGGSSPSAAQSYFTVHGTLSASLADGHGGSGTLNLAF